MSVPTISTYHPPSHLTVSDKLGEDWKLWKQQWSLYVTVAELGGKPEPFRTAVLLHSLGPDGLKIYNTFDFPSAEHTVAQIISKFDEYAIGEVNEIYERYVFGRRDQKEGEGVDTFITDLKHLVQTCNYGDLTKSLLRDRIVLGIKNDNTRAKLLRERQLTFEKCCDICKISEKTENRLKHFDNISVHKVTKQANLTKQQETATTGLIMCKFCANEHVRDKFKCPAWGKKCSLCSRDNHFAKCCLRKKTTSKIHRTTSKIHRLDDVDSGSEEDGEILSISHHKDSSGPLYVKLKLPNGNPVKFQVDSGATVSVICQKYLPNVNLQKSRTKLSMYNKSIIEPLGVTRVSLLNPVNGKIYNILFQVVKEDLVPILSRKTAEAMRLITVNYSTFEQIHMVGNTGQILHEYSDVFNGGLGSLPGNVNLHVNKDVKPIQCLARRIPIAYKSSVKEELLAMVKKGVIVPVATPSAWCSQISVTIKKNGKLRMCIDPQALNKALTREIYHLPVIEDVLPELSKAKVFSKLDLSNGYWHCILDEDSSMLTSFATPFGRFRWMRLPFGLKVSSEIFQRKLCECLEGLEGIACVADDILVFGTSQSVHDESLKRLLTRCSEKGIKLNKEKCEFNTKEIDFLGHVISCEGLKVDSKKIEAIMKMNKPDNVEAVRRLQGTVNYLSHFLPKLSDVMEPIRRLTHKNVRWEWGKDQDIAFTNVKKLVTSAPILQYYDQNKELSIECDASSKGLGAVLMQEGKPVAYISRALTNSEKNFAQIEKECLAIVFAVERFHQYTFGRKTTVHSDHKPLQSIVKKPLCNAPKRLQTMLLRLLPYHIDVFYKKGCEMHLSDMLSRAYILDHDFKPMMQLNAVSHLPISKNRLEVLRKATDEDDTMLKLKSVILRGWPDSKQDLPEQLTPYYSYRDEMIVHDGLVFKGERVTVPISYRSVVKNHLHLSHLGRESMLRRARMCVFWPGMTSEIGQVADSCEACSSFNKAQQKETLMPIESNYPYEVVGVDLFAWKGKDYLVTVDYYSGHWEIDRLYSTSSCTVINKLKVHFARNGIPCKVVSDNGPQFSAQEFNVFSNQWDFKHTPSSPGHPQANGKAESAVKAAKAMMNKCNKSGTDVYLSLLEIRNTPTQGADSSPAQRLLNRCTRSLLPITTSMLVPRGTEISDYDKVRLQRNQKQQIDHYNKGAKDLQPLAEGDVVRMKPFTLNQKEWQKATVTRRLDERSYEVETEKGNVRRNRVHLKEAEKQGIEIPESIISEPQSTEPLESLIQDNESPTSEPVSASPIVSPTTRTRSGRVSKKPNRLNL